MNSRRTSAVQSIRLEVVTSASALQVGDLGEFRAQSRALAVQRQVSAFLENEGDFGQYPLFSKPIPQPDMQGRVQFFARNTDPWIRTGHVMIVAAAASSLVHVGSVRQMEMESRVKHIRQFVTTPDR